MHVPPCWGASIPVLCQAASSSCTGGPRLPLAAWFCLCVLWLLAGQGPAHHHEALRCAPSITIGCMISVITCSQKPCPFEVHFNAPAEVLAVRWGREPCRSPWVSVCLDVRGYKTAAFGSASTYSETEVCVAFGSITVLH